MCCILVRREQYATPNSDIYTSVILFSLGMLGWRYNPNMSGKIEDPFWKQPLQRVTIDKDKGVVGGRDRIIRMKQIDRGI